MDHTVPAPRSSSICTPPRSMLGARQPSGPARTQDRARPHAVPDAKPYPLKRPSRRGKGWTHTCIDLDPSLAIGPTRAVDLQITPRPRGGAGGYIRPRRQRKPLCLPPSCLRRGVAPAVPLRAACASRERDICCAEPVVQALWSNWAKVVHRRRQLSACGAPLHLEATSEKK